MGSYGNCRSHSLRIAGALGHIPACTEARHHRLSGALPSRIERQMSCKSTILDPGGTSNEFLGELIERRALCAGRIPGSGPRPEVLTSEGKAIALLAFVHWFRGYEHP
jgi:hypothetical protein